MDMLSQLEETYSFKLPNAYREFFSRGYLTHPGDDYLWVYDAEWFLPTEMLDKGGFWGNPKPGLVAFAFSGGRDLWAWQTLRLSDAGEPMIVYCPRDCYEGWWYSPSFLGWLYHISLEYAFDFDVESETKQNLYMWAAVLEEFGQLKWSDDIKSVAQRKVTLVKSGPRGQIGSNSLINERELNERILEEFGEGFVNVRYVWDIQGDPV